MGVSTGNRFSSLPKSTLRKLRSSAGCATRLDPSRARSAVYGKERPTSATSLGEAHRQTSAALLDRERAASKAASPCCNRSLVGRSTRHRPKRPCAVLCAASELAVGPCAQPRRSLERSTDSMATRRCAHSTGEREPHPARAAPLYVRPPRPPARASRTLRSTGTRCVVLARALHGAARRGASRTGPRHAQQRAPPRQEGASPSPERSSRGARRRGVRALPPRGPAASWHAGCSVST